MRSIVSSMKTKIKPKILKSKTSIVIAIGVVAALLIIVLLLVYSSKNPIIPSSALKIGNSPVLGEEDAPVVIYEFSDFSCPFCAAAEGKNQDVVNMLKSRIPGWEAPMPLVKKNYVDTGKVKIVFKYYPGHGSATAAHAVALGLNKQNPELFWKFAGIAFASQTTLNLNDIVKMKAIAIELGANKTKLDNYIASKEYESQLAEDIKMSDANNVDGTPTFFINGEMIAGAKSFADFEAIIEKELTE